MPAPAPRPIGGEPAYDDNEKTLAELKVRIARTIAYNILRHNGVEIGKRDYLGNP